MSVGTLDQLIAGLQPPSACFKNAVTAQAAGVLHSTVYLAGVPGAMTAPSSGLAGAAVTSSRAGMIPFPAAVSGDNVYLAGMDAAHAANVGAIILADRLWDNSGITSTTTTGQTVNSATWPSRDGTGGTNGVNVLIGLEVSAATGNGAPVTTITATYTDSAGNSGNTATMASFPTTAVAGTFVPFALAAGDTGVRSIQTLTLGTSLVSGTVNLVAYRPVAVIPTPTANIATRLDAIQCGMPKLWDNSALFALLLPTATAVGVTQFTPTFTQN